MALKWVRRKNGKIVEASRFRQSGMTEQIHESDPEYIAFKQEPFSIQKAKKKAIDDNLPDWATVKQAISNISNLEEAKTFLEKLSRVVYWLAKNKED